MNEEFKESREGMQQMQDFSSVHAVFEKLNRERKFRWSWFVVSRSPLVAPIRPIRLLSPPLNDANGSALESISGMMTLHEHSQAKSLNWRLRPTIGRLRIVRLPLHTFLPKPDCGSRE